jgi:hypothetical protein
LYGPPWLQKSCWPHWPHNGLVSQVSEVGLNSLASLIGLIGHIGISGHDGLFGNCFVGHIGIFGHIKLVKLISLIGLIGLVGLNGLIGHIHLVGCNDHFNIGCTSHTVLVGLLNFVGHNDRIGLVGLVLSHISLIGLVGLVSISFNGLISLDGHIGHNGLIGEVIFVSLGLVAVGLGNVRIKFEMKTKLSSCCLFARESWLWCVRRVFSSLTGLNSVFGNALQNATQLFFDRIPQMNKYFVMRECEHIADTSISSQEGISIFKFPEMFSEIS